LSIVTRQAGVDSFDGSQGAGLKQPLKALFIASFKASALLFFQLKAGKK
jgi:hypothetical protein